MSTLKTISSLLRTSRLQKLRQCGPQLEAFRGLYSASSLGIDSFTQQQERTKRQLGNIEEKFKAKMMEYTEEGSKNVVFTEDLKNMIHIAEASDIDIITKMMKKFNQQNKELRFGNFVFGPVAMRLFYILNKPDEALECFKSPELEGFFDQLITYQLLFDMLFENQRYNDILECFNIIRDRQVEGPKYPRNIVVIMFATYYKMNTPESLEFAKKLWTELQEVAHFPARRATTFFAVLALNQKQPEMSLEILSSVKNQNYTTVRNLKALTMAKLNRVDDIIPLLKSILNQEQIHTFNKDVLDVVKEVIDNQENKDLQIEFNHIMKIFQEQNHISNLNLQEQLTAEIDSRRFIQPQDSENNRFVRRRFSYGQPRVPPRMALRDME